MNQTLDRVEYIERVMYLLTRHESKLDGGHQVWQVLAQSVV